MAESPSTTARVHADFSQRVVVPPARDDDWVASPQPGVSRRLLDRVDSEMARATSPVRCAPGARFSAHVHHGGGEFLVLEGTLADEAGSNPAGSYVRHPPGCRHAPYSPADCLLFVKLWQFAAGGDATVRIDTRRERWRPGLVPGLEVMPLHAHDGIDTALVRWAPHMTFGAHVHPGCEEILVLRGVLHDEHGAYPAGTLLRSPRYSRHAPFTGGEGTLIYGKVGHVGAPLLPLPFEANALT